MLDAEHSTRLGTSLAAFLTASLSPAMGRTVIGRTHRTLRAACYRTSLPPAMRDTESLERRFLVLVIKKEQKNCFNLIAGSAHTAR